MLTLTSSKQPLLELRGARGLGRIAFKAPFYCPAANRTLLETKAAIAQAGGVLALIGTHHQCTMTVDITLTPSMTVVCLPACLSACLPLCLSVLSLSLRLLLKTRRGKFSVVLSIRTGALLGSLSQASFATGLVQRCKGRYDFLIQGAALAGRTRRRTFEGGEQPMEYEKDMRNRPAVLDALT